MAEHGDSGLHAKASADGLGNAGADPAVGVLAVARLLLFLLVLVLGFFLRLAVLADGGAGLGACSFRHGDDAEPFAAPPPLGQMLADAVDVIGYFWYKDN